MVCRPLYFTELLPEQMAFCIYHRLGSKEMKAFMFPVFAAGGLEAYIDFNIEGSQWTSRTDWIAVKYHGKLKWP